MSHSFITTLENADVTVFFDYEPEQVQTRTDPPFSSEVVVTSVIIGEAEFFELDDVFLPAVIQRFTELAFESMEDQNESY